MGLGLKRIWIAWGALGIGFASFSCNVTTQPASSNDEIAKLKAEVARLKAQSSERPPKGQEAAFATKRGAELEERITHEKEDLTAQTEERKLLQQALDVADKTASVPPKSGGAIDKLHCYTTLCRVETTHMSQATFQAFMQVAFNGVPGKPVSDKDCCPKPDKDWGGPRIYPGWYSVARTGMSGGKMSALFYVGRVRP